MANRKDLTGAKMSWHLPRYFVVRRSIFMNESEEFWEKHYSSREKRRTGKPNAALVRFAEALTVGAALDLGCAEGNDSIWLARRGWRVVAVDVSATALERAAANAASAGVAERIEFQRHDLAESFPEGEFDLVSALFLQSPIEFPRARVLQRAAKSVATGGLLLVVEHASVAPWSWSDPDTIFPTPPQSLAELELTPDDWTNEFVGAPERQATGPNGETATVKDNVLALRLLGRR